MSRIRLLACVAATVPSATIFGLTITTVPVLAQASLPAGPLVELRECPAGMRPSGRLECQR